MRQTFATLTQLIPLSHPLISEEVPVGIIAGGTVGSTILLFIFLLVLVLIFYRQRKGSESSSPCAQLIQYKNPICMYSRRFHGLWRRTKSTTSLPPYGWCSPLNSLLRLMKTDRPRRACPAVFNLAVFCFQVGAGSRWVSPTSRWRP